MPTKSHTALNKPAAYDLSVDTTCQWLTANETHFILEHISFSLYLFSLKRLVSHENAKMHHHLKVGLSLDTVINADTPAP